MKIAALALVLPLMAFGQVQGGHSANLTIENGATSVVEQSTPQGHSGPIGINGREVGQGVNSSTAMPVDPYPGLTAANNTYKKAVAQWQNAYQQHQLAVQNLAQFKEKYLDENGAPRREWEATSVKACLYALENRVDDAYYELSNAEKTRNEASSHANAEFRAASAQFARAEQERAEQARAEEAARAAAAKRGTPPSEKFDHH